MLKFIFIGILATAFLAPVASVASIKAGVGRSDITPSIGTQSVGFFERENKGMTGVHDPLLANALIIDNGEKMIAFCSMDHIGLLREACLEIIQNVHNHPGLKNCEVYIGCSHTHSGGGASFNIPEIGEMLAGPYDPKITQIYVDGAVKAIIEAYQNLQSAKIGIGYGQVKGLSTYDGMYPKTMDPPSDLTVIKVTKLDDSPLGVFLNYTIYPDALVYNNVIHPGTPNEETMYFSADVVGYIRSRVQSLIGKEVVPVFFNGATADVLVKISNPENRFESCDYIGKKVAEGVKRIWSSIKAKDNVEISTQKDIYLFEPKPTLAGYLIQVEKFPTEMNLIVFDHKDAFITLPAEPSFSFDPVLKAVAKKLGYAHLSILELVNDNHGYVYSPEAWRLNPAEADFSWGGEMYGQLVEDKVKALLKYEAKQ